MRLIDADKLIEKINNFHIADARCVTVMNGVANLIKEQPNAYDLDKVVEELEKELEVGNIAIDYGEFRLFEIVKQGGVTKNCNDCANYTEHDEVDNGCYLCCKGYEDNYEPKVDNGGVSDDVCRWKFEEETGFAWHCDNKCATYNLVYAKNLKIILDDFECKCPYCGKKIKVVE